MCLGVKFSRSFLALPLSGTLLLIGCATPQQRCVNDATRDLKTVTELKAVTEANLARGYAVDVSYVPYTVYETCYSGYRRAYSCPRTQTRTVTTPRTIDVALEKRKLADLNKKQILLRKQSSEWVAQCQAKYPE